MNNPLDTLKQIRLSEGKKSEIRQALSAHIDTSTQVSRWQEFVSGLSKVGTPATALAVMLVMLGGVSLAAENSLPGDRLYPVKVNINEEFLTLTSVSLESEALNNSRIAERRIGEIEQLAADGVLDQETSDKLADAVTEHAARARKQIAEISAEGEAGSALSLEAELVSTLRTHSDILEDLSISNDGEKSTTTAAVALRLRSIAEDKASNDVATLRSSDSGSLTTSTRVRGPLRSDDLEMSASSSSTDKTALSEEEAKKLLQRSADRLQAAQEIFTKAASDFSTDAIRLKLEDTLALAADEIDGAVDAIEKEDYHTAEDKMRRALTLAHETTIIIKTRQKLSASTKVNIDDLLDDNEFTNTDSTTEKEREAETDRGGQQGGKLLPTNTDSQEPETTTKQEEVSSSMGTDSNSENLVRIEEAISPVVYEKIDSVLKRVSSTLATSTNEGGPSKNGLLPARTGSDRNSEELDENQNTSTSEDSAR